MWEKLFRVIQRDSTPRKQKKGESQMESMMAKCVETNANIHTASSASAAWFYLIQPIRHIQSDKRFKLRAMFLRLRFLPPGKSYVFNMWLYVWVRGGSRAFDARHRYKRQPTSRFSLQFALNDEKGYNQFAIRRQRIKRYDKNGPDWCGAHFICEIEINREG